MKAKLVKESLNEEIKPYDVPRRSASGSFYNTQTQLGEPVNNLNVNGLFDVYIRKNKRGTFYDFFENGNNGYKISEKSPMVYTYGLDSGNITRGSDSQWARQEVRSRSKAFNKGNPNKMEIPDDLDKAINIIINNYINYNPQK